MRLNNISIALVAIGLSVSGAAFAATSNTTTIQVGVSSSTTVNGFTKTITLEDQNASTLQETGVTESLAGLQIYTDDPDGMTITVTGNNVMGNQPALEYNSNYIPISLSYRACGTGNLNLDLIPASATGNSNTITVNETNYPGALANNFSASACDTQNGSATLTIGGSGMGTPTVIPTANGEYYSSTVDITVAPV